MVGKDGADNRGLPRSPIGLEEKSRKWTVVPLLDDTPFSEMKSLSEAQWKEGRMVVSMLDMLSWVCLGDVLVELAN